MDESTGRIAQRTVLWLPRSRIARSRPLQRRSISSPSRKKCCPCALLDVAAAYCGGVAAGLSIPTLGMSIPTAGTPAAILAIASLPFHGAALVIDIFNEEWYMIKKKTFFIINICVVLLFAIYLVTALFIDYPKYVKIIILSVYFSYAVMRAICFIKQFYKL